MKAQRKERNPKVSVKTLKGSLTKSQMVEILQRMEAAAFLELKRSERDYGSNDSFTTQCRTRWAGINSTLTALGIRQDFSLPDNVEAMAIIVELIAKQRA